MTVPPSGSRSRGELGLGPVDDGASVDAARVEERPDADARRCGGSEAGGDQKRLDEAEEVGEGAEDERAERLAAEEDDRVDGEAAAADPGGEEELQRGVERREHDHPGDAGRDQQHQHRDGVVEQRDRGQHQRVEAARERDQGVDREAVADAGEHECACDRAEPERGEQEPVAA